jgi:ribulose-phosphate 3-epimerase
MTTDRLARLPKDRLLAELSLWSADLGRLEGEIARTEPYADVYHLDVADGHFAPALLFFPDLVARLRRLTERPFHVHLMVADAVLLPQVEQFAEAGADLVSVHAESRNLAAVLDLIASLGLRSGVVLRLETPVEAARPALERVDFLTLLGTAIGVKGQGLSDQACPRLGRARALLREVGREREVVVAADGGIRETTVPRLRAAGADTVVMGSLAFGAPSLAERIAWLRALPPPADRAA